MSAPAFWAVVPAAGVGRRMGADRPKQYLDLDGQAVIVHSVARVLTDPRVLGAVVAIAPTDPYWPGLRIPTAKPIRTVIGGHERADSVWNALLALGEAATSWVVVHDAARPCLRPGDLEHLLDQAIASGDDGAILAVPVRDTMKRADAEGRITATVERRQLWHALTPQVFRLDPLRHALRGALDAGHPVTDEASAMEWAGRAPRLVEGHGDNVKITHPTDLSAAHQSLTAQAVAQDEVS